MDLLLRQAQHPRDEHLKYKVNLFLLIIILVACGNQPVLSDVSIGRTDLDLAQGQESLISYRIGEPATLSIWLQDDANQHYMLRDAVEREPSNDPYQFLFDGSVALDAQTQRVLPNGTYTLTIQAESQAAAAPVVEQHTITLVNAPEEQFDVFDLVVTPNPFSPNEDAIDDVTNFTYRLPVSATVTIDIIDPDSGERYPFVTNEERGPGEHSETWSGRPVVGGFLPANTYPYELLADDGRGNRVIKQGEVEISAAGIGKLSVLEATIEPEQIELGDMITVTIRVQNTGPVGLRTHGPPSGYVYSSNQTYSSIEAESYATKGGGLWRVGLDWQGNSGSGARYPFRWAISPRPPEAWVEPGEFDVLQPGEEATITGNVIVKQREDRMTFFVGVAQEGVGYPFHRLRQTLIEVGF